MKDTRLREFETIKSDIVERLEERQGEQAYLCDLGFQLTESEKDRSMAYWHIPKPRIYGR